MRRWLPPVGIGLALAVAVAVTFAAASSVGRTPAERADALAAELRCPDCQGLSVADSPTRSAREIRRQIDELVAGGATDDEVRTHFTERYGEWIRLSPRAPSAWAVPFAVIALALVGLGVWIRHGGRRPSPAAADAPLSDEERRRLHRDAEALDA